MTVSEDNALNHVLRWVLGQGGDQSRARTDAMWLAERASGTLHAGLTADDVAQHWPGGQPRNDAVIVAEFIDAWDGTDSHARDVLTAIRDQLDGRTP